MLSFLDGFSGYNQVLVNKDDMHKTTFTTPWGTYEYLRMPFGLMNASATFQRAMDYAFKDLMGKIIEIYQDDLTVFSKDKKSHVEHLRQVFERCHKYEISLNPKKSIFGVVEGNILGHIVSKYGVKVDPERIKGIKEISLPRTQKALQSFFSKINFIQRFIPNFVKITKPITKLLKKYEVFKWDEDSKTTFKLIKEAIVKSPVLVSPNYSKNFQFFSFASNDTIVGVLLQKNDQDEEQPIAFMSKVLRDVKLKYSIMEKQAYALVKSLKHFRMYVGYSKVISYVPHLM
jgi:hypothetical protein